MDLPPLPPGPPPDSDSDDPGPPPLDDFADVPPPHEGGPPLEPPPAHDWSDDDEAAEAGFTGPEWAQGPPPDAPPPPASPADRRRQMVARQQRGRHDAPAARDGRQDSDAGQRRGHDPHRHDRHLQAGGGGVAAPVGAGGLDMAARKAAYGRFMPGGAGPAARVPAVRDSSDSDSDGEAATVPRGSAQPSYRASASGLQGGGSVPPEPPRGSVGTAPPRPVGPYELVPPEPPRGSVAAPPVPAPPPGEAAPPLAGHQYQAEPPRGSATGVPPAPVGLEPPPPGRDSSAPAPPPEAPAPTSAGGGLLPVLEPPRASALGETGSPPAPPGETVAGQLAAPPRGSTTASVPPPPSEVFADQEMTDDEDDDDEEQLSERQRALLSATLSGATGDDPRSSEVQPAQNETEGGSAESSRPPSPTTATPSRPSGAAGYPPLMFASAPSAQRAGSTSSKASRASSNSAQPIATVKHAKRQTVEEKGQQSASQEEDAAPPVAAAPEPTGEGPPTPREGAGRAIAGLPRASAPPQLVHSPLVTNVVSPPPAGKADARQLDRRPRNDAPAQPQDGSSRAPATPQFASTPAMPPVQAAGVPMTPTQEVIAEQQQQYQRYLEMRQEHLRTQFEQQQNLFMQQQMMMMFSEGQLQSATAQLRAQQLEREEALAKAARRRARLKRKGKSRSQKTKANHELAAAILGQPVAAGDGDGDTTVEEPVAPEDVRTSTRPASTPVTAISTSDVHVAGAGAKTHEDEAGTQALQPDEAPAARPRPRPATEQASFTAPDVDAVMPRPEPREMDQSGPQPVETPEVSHSPAGPGRPAGPSPRGVPPGVPHGYPRGAVYGAPYGDSAHMARAAAHMQPRGAAPIAGIGMQTYAAHGPYPGRGLAARPRGPAHWQPNSMPLGAHNGGSPPSGVHYAQAHSGAILVTLPSSPSSPSGRDSPQRPRRVDRDHVMERAGQHVAHQLSQSANSAPHSGKKSKRSAARSAGRSRSRRAHGRSTKQHTASSSGRRRKPVSDAVARMERARQAANERSMKQAQRLKRQAAAAKAKAKAAQLAPAAEEWTGSTNVGSRTAADLAAQSLDPARAEPSPKLWKSRRYRNSIARVDTGLSLSPRATSADPPQRRPTRSVSPRHGTGRSVSPMEHDQAHNTASPKLWKARKYRNSMARVDSGLSPAQPTTARGRSTERSKNLRSVAASASPTMEKRPRLPPPPVGPPPRQDPPSYAQGAHGTFAQSADRLVQLDAAPQGRGPPATVQMEMPRFVYSPTGTRATAPNGKTPPPPPPRMHGAAALPARNRSSSPMKHRSSGTEAVRDDAGRSHGRARDDGDQVVHQGRHHHSRKHGRKHSHRSEGSHARDVDTTRSRRREKEARSQHDSSRSRHRSSRKHRSNGHSNQQSSRRRDDGPKRERTNGSRTAPSAKLLSSTLKTVAISRASITAFSRGLIAKSAAEEEDRNALLFDGGKWASTAPGMPPAIVPGDSPAYTKKAVARVPPSGSRKQLLQGRAYNPEYMPWVQLEETDDEQSAKKTPPPSKGHEKQSRVKVTVGPEDEDSPRDSRGPPIAAPDIMSPGQDAGWSTDDG